MAAEVVFGAGKVRQCSKSHTLMRVPQVGVDIGPAFSVQGSAESAVCLRVVPEQMHEPKEVTGFTRFNDVTSMARNRMDSVRACRFTSGERELR